MIEVVDISKLSDLQLKALAFDILMQLNQIQSNFNQIQAEIRKREELKARAKLSNAQEELKKEEEKPD